MKGHQSKAPLVGEGKPHGKGAPRTKPNSATSAKGHLLQNDAPSHKSAKGSFTAPRSDGGHKPFECGYTKL